MYLLPADYLALGLLLLLILVSLRYHRMVRKLEQRLRQCEAISDAHYRKATQLQKELNISKCKLVRISSNARNNR